MIRCRGNKFARTVFFDMILWRAIFSDLAGWQQANKPVVSYITWYLKNTILISYSIIVRIN